ncbi:MAG: hypothetical protein QMD65_01695 [Patescibacteria group bacterium]|nr:hypothetical protein [Patescibacteria group bacterium]
MSKVIQEHFMVRQLYAKNKKGFIAILAVLIIGAIGITITISVLLLGLGFTQSSFIIEQSGGARALANACVDQALQQIRNFPLSFSGRSLTINSGTCNYVIIDNGGQNRTINAKATLGGVTRKAKIVINKINPYINIASWQEVADN